MNFDFVVGAVRVESVWDGEGKWKRFQNDGTEEYDANIARNLFEYPGLSETDLMTRIVCKSEFFIFRSVEITQD